MELTTRLAQESRPTRLLVQYPYAVGNRAKDGTITLSEYCVPADLDPIHGAGQ